ncbi:CHAT domain-containing protein [Paracidobacterium acidisoli]|nr:CHAT domain-containing protein [Paracidobacterium acidisoli]MBT9332394.1 CHAT domain-containing protein [Paracidobacterium acidisoli]
MESSLPLTCERAFSVILLIEGRTHPAQTFRSPINDEQWREFIRQLRDCNVNRDVKTGYRGATAIRALARSLYQALAQISPALREFLDRAGVPRRLVIQTTRPELHLLPWAAMYDESGHPLAAGDLSVVQSWQDFDELPVSMGSRLQLLKVLGADTNQRTAAALDSLKRTPEIVQIDATNAFDAGRAVDQIDILHLEEHGNAVRGTIGDVSAAALGAEFAKAKIALLWSCYSGAADSWGESPALALHRSGAELVLSFLAELHNEDAGSISEAFYGDVFGPAASRDPESALVRIRTAKMATEFGFANWASMTVCLRRSLDLSALPLNGPRVPAQAWVEDTIPEGTAAAGFWKDVAAQVSRLQPGTKNVIDASSIAYAKLPVTAFQAWRGNVIRIDEGMDVMPDDATLRELGLAAEAAPNADPVDRLTWFFAQIARFGSPLIVWTGAEPRHLEFLKTVEPGAQLTFLLLYGLKPNQPGLMELVDENRLEEALTLCGGLSQDCGDEQLYAAYYACVRGEHPEQALSYLARIQSRQERLLLMGNYLSRNPVVPLSESLLSSFGEWARGERPTRPEDFYRLAMNVPEGESSLRETGRSKHELAWMMQATGQPDTAELLFRLALADIEASGQDPDTRRDSRWYFALSSILRDWADLLAQTPERLEEASQLLHRAMAVQSFHGMRLELAYSTMTAARIALAGSHYTKAIDLAVDAANRFVECNNGRGWCEALSILFDTFAETRQTARMLSLAALAEEKLTLSNLPGKIREEQMRDLAFQQARAFWIAGDLINAREKLQALRSAADLRQVNLDPKILRLYDFLRPFLHSDPAQQH